MPIDPSKLAPEKIEDLATLQHYAVGRAASQSAPCEGSVADRLEPSDADLGRTACIITEYGNASPLVFLGRGLPL